MTIGRSPYDFARFSVEADPIHVVVVRRRLRELLLFAGVADQIVDDLVLTGSELVTNAIEAARPNTRVTVEIGVDEHSVALAVENTGPGFQINRSLALPNPAQLRGRGLAIAAQLVENVSAEQLGGRTRVVALRHLIDSEAPTGHAPAGSAIDPVGHGTVATTVDGATRG